MIQFTQETLIPLREAPRHLPCRPGGKRVHISACYRWVTSGLRGVVLDSLKLGGTTYTSLEAIQRFAEEVTVRARAATSRPASASPSRVRMLKAVESRLESELGMDPGRLSSRRADGQGPPSAGHNGHRG